MYIQDGYKYKCSRSSVADPRSNMPNFSDCTYSGVAAVDIAYRDFGVPSSRLI